MNHPILIAALVEDRHHQCPCGTFAQRPYGECRAVAVWRKETATARHSAIPNQACAGNAEARVFARVASLLHLISGKAES